MAVKALESEGSILGSFWIVDSSLGLSLVLSRFVVEFCWRVGNFDFFTFYVFEEDGCFVRASLALDPPKLKSLEALILDRDVKECSISLCVELSLVFETSSIFDLSSLPFLARGY